MDRRLARKNVVTALIAAFIVFFMFGMSFVAALLYIS
jgi:hypothetical protein